MQSFVTALGLRCPPRTWRDWQSTLYVQMTSQVGLVLLSLIQRIALMSASLLTAFSASLHGIHFTQNNADGIVPATLHYP